jgi:hypothetical protein
MKSGLTGRRGRLEEAVQWVAKGQSDWFWFWLKDVRKQEEEKEEAAVDDRLCFWLGWGLYWYGYQTSQWKAAGAPDQAFGERCLEYYVQLAELQQKSLFLFLVFWNRATGVKEVGKMIGQMAWAGRTDRLIKKFKRPEELKK